MIATVMTGNGAARDGIPSLLNPTTPTRRAECPNSTLALAITARDLRKPPVTELMSRPQGDAPL
jgi:hypothetical protein